jgi:two-component system phosphate regulon sensor histidine kinase PhoR
MTEKLKQDIEQLKKLERVRSEFLGNVSHELRTPIFSLKGFLETLMDGAIDDPQVNRAFIQRAYAHATRLDTLLADLIEISRIESGEMRMSFRYFDVAEFLSQVREDYVDDAEKKKQSLALELPSREISVYGDKERLRQALGNILDNAVKYTQGGTTIILRAEERDGMVEISVKDNGPGIPAEHLPRIFERFYRVDKNRSRDVGGTGLGLAIVKHIVEAHGGKIHVASEVGKGTKFWFELKK